MNGTGYVYKGERWFKYLFEIFIMIIMGKHDPANWKFIITIIVILFGALFRIFSSRRAIFVQAKKAECFYKLSRHPDEFGIALQFLAILLYMNNVYQVIIALLLFIILMMIIIGKKEFFLKKRFSGYNVYRSKTPLFIPRVKFCFKDLFQRENEQLPSLKIWYVLETLLPVIFLLEMRFRICLRLIRLLEPLFS